MTSSSASEVLEAETRRLAQRGYTIYRGASGLVPPPLEMFTPDAIAVGRDPKYLIEVVREGPETLEKLQALRHQIAKMPDWELLVVLDRGVRSPELRPATMEQIKEALHSVQKVVSAGEAASGLLLSWGVFEALSRKLIPEEFARAQSPGRLIQILASEGYLIPSEERLLRRLAKARNAIIHGELSEGVGPAEVKEFAGILTGLLQRIQ